MINFPKILQLGDRRIVDHLVKGEVEITEKVDGSLFGFGRDDNGALHCRSKGQDFIPENAPTMFKPAVDNIDRALVEAYLSPGDWIFGETLQKPRHNTLSYERVPLKHLIVFGFWAGKGGWASWDSTADTAEALGYEVVPLLYRGYLPSLQDIEAFLETPSILGKEKIEGVVIKHTTAFWTGFGEPLPVICKSVRADFKEKNSKAWSAEKMSGESKIALVLEQYRTEPRWQKAIQHLTEAGLLEGRMQDMPKLVAEVKRDVLDECKEEIKEELFNAVKKDLERACTRGLPEFYKLHLAKETANAIV